MSDSMKKHTRAVQAAIKADPTKRIASYQGCHNMVLKHLPAARARVAALPEEPQDKRAALASALIEIILPLASSAG